MKVKQYQLLECCNTYVKIPSDRLALLTAEAQAAVQEGICLNFSNLNWQSALFNKKEFSPAVKSGRDSMFQLAYLYEQVEILTFISVFNKHEKMQ